MRLGLTQGFSNEANFRGISDEELKIDEVIHKAFIEVSCFSMINSNISDFGQMNKAVRLPQLPV
jgi:serine protease inhibitor